MTKTLLIGIGNPLRGDDAVGWHAISLLGEKIDQPHVDMITVQQLTMDLVDVLENVERVIFIDARIGDSPGQIQYRHIAASTGLNTSVSHFFDPDTLLAAVQALYGRHPDATLYTIDASEFEIGADLSPQVNTSLKVLVDNILQEIAN